ncbi:MAG TPA: 50S ribosomal protein L17 [Candidatus Azoamicus sp.]
MRHRNIGRYFNRNSEQRKALFLNLCKDLIKYGIIKTTLAKAKELRMYIEPLITLSKIDSINNRRLAFKKIRDKNIVHVLFSVLGKRYVNRNGGYTRVLKYGIRHGDCATLAFIELLDRHVNG